MEKFFNVTDIDTEILEKAQKRLGIEDGQCYPEVFMSAHFMHSLETTGL